MNNTNRIRKWIFPLLVPVLILFALSQVSGVGHGVAAFVEDLLRILIVYYLNREINFIVYNC